MNIININDDDIIKYNNIFKQDNIIKIDNFFMLDTANYLYKNIINIKIWYQTCGIKKERYEKHINLQNTKQNQYFINRANNAFSNNDFSYNFHRTMYNKPAEMSIIELKLRQLLSSSDFVNLIKSITNVDVTKLNTMFLAKYNSGHFLSPHSDKGNGKIAFVINLTRNWKPQYGGNLHFLNNTRDEVIKVITPKFNSIVLFYVPPEGIPHFVSHVSPFVKQNRFTITGWYD